jgi:hypothetical protein
MGKTDNKITDSTATGTGDSENNTSTKSSSKRGRPRKDRGDGATDTSSQANLPKLVLVDVPEEKENIFDRDEKENVPSPKKPKKIKNQEKLEIKKEQLSVLIKSVFDVIGTRQEIWKLSKQECDMIAEPLSSILSKNTTVEKFALEYGDYVALCIALATIVIPRFIIQLKTTPKKEKISYVNFNKTGETRGDTTDKSGKNGVSGDNAPRKTSSSSSNLSSELYNFLPALQ